ncbi:MAG: mucoidy inhibitor MuiA family protein [Pseudomonadota bacterium]
MLGLLLSAMLSAAVPDVSSGPDLADEARTVALPIDEVTVFSDRARIRRRGSVRLERGPHALRLPDLPGATLLNTVHVSAARGQVLRVEIAPVERERMSIEQVDTLVTQLEGISDQLARLDAEQAVFQAELGLLRRASPKTAVPEQERVGKPQPPLVVSGWMGSLDFLATRQAAVQEVLRAQNKKRQELGEAFAKAQRDVARYDLGALSDRRNQVLAIVDVNAAALVELELVYSVPGAAWWPAYDLHFSPADGSVTLYTAGQVQQASGEAWDNVALVLSTSMPGQDIELPELLTWTLGERKDFMPSPRPERALPQPQRFAAPGPRPHPAQAERAARQEALQERMTLLSMLLQGQGVSTESGMGSGIGSARRPGVSSIMGGDGVATRSLPQPRPVSRAPAAPPPPPAAMERMDMEDVSGEAEGMSFATLSDAPLAQGAPSGGRASNRRSRQPRTPATSLALFDPTTWQRPRLGDVTLPAMVAGGLDYEYRASTRATVASDGERLRVPLSSATYKTTLTYETTPALATTAYLSAKVENGGRLPILRGPVNVFVGGAFTSEGQLQTTGPGGSLTLPLGADEDIRVIHHVTAQTKSTGILIKDEVTAYTTRIEIGNFKSRPISIDVFDVLPMTGNDKMEVALEQAQPALADKPDAKGRLRWHLNVPPKKTQVVTFTYSIKRPPDWQLRQR